MLNPTKSTKGKPSELPMVLLLQKRAKPKEETWISLEHVSRGYITGNSVGVFIV